MTLAPPASLQTGQEKSSVPELGEKQQSRTGDPTPTIQEPSQKESGADPAKADPKSKKRSLFGFGKRKTEEKAASKTSKPDAGLPSTSSAQTTLQASPRRSATGSPIQIDSPRKIPSSPGRGGVYSTSPRLGSPAGSQIFERDVQESTALPTSPAIPSHIQTEDYIPSVLDASSEAITDDHLNPDTVEIITHTSHQPAVLAVTGSTPYDSAATSWAEDLAAFSDKEESASNYGSLDSADVRRLSFISFADVVQAEHGPPPGVAGSRESMHLAGLTSLSSLGPNRSPSPIRSPVSSQGGETSPPNSNSGSVKGFSMSPVRKPLGSPTSTEHNLLASGELNIETMSQALRRTGSTDLSTHRSLPISPIEGLSR